MSAITIDELKKIRKKLDKSDEDAVIIENLTKLQSVTVSKTLIKDSKIGKTLGKLRKHQNSQISSISSDLVKDWKKLVGEEQEAKPSDTTNNQNNDNNNNNNNSNNDNSEKKRKNGNDDSKKKDEKETPSKKVKNETPSKEKEKERSKSSSEDDQTRTKAVEVLIKALGDKKESDAMDIEDVAKEIEQELFKMFRSCDKNYKAKLRSLCFNLKNPKNPELRDSIMMAEVSATKLCLMTHSEMASEELKQERQRILKYHMEAAQAKLPNQTSTDMFKCGKCGRRETTYYQLQTRSADEPMTTFHTCTRCGHRWKS